MRYLLSLLFIFFLSDAGAQSCKPETLAEAEALAASGKIYLKGNAASQSYDVNYYRLQVRLDPTITFIQGAVSMHFRVKHNLLTSLELDLVSGLQVDSVRYHGLNCFFQQQSNHVLQVFLPDVLTMNQQDSITTYYHGQPANTGLGSFGSAAHPSGVAMWTLSEPYGSREWWPAKMTLDDKADSMDVIISTPQQYRGASSGMLVQDTIIDSLRTVHWQHRYPIATYLISVAVSNYAVYSDYWVHHGDSLEILNYVYPHNLALAKSQTPYTASCLELYSNLFEDYPFRRERYGHAQFSRGGGMEHQTMSFMVNFSEDLIAHELAHQWFGDKVTCGSWRDIWLNEGFATYLTGLTYENLKHDSLWMKWKRSVIGNVCSQPEGSVYPKDTVDVFALFDSRLTYNKGAFVLHMLRYTMGDQKFFKGVQDHLNDSTAAYGFSNTSRLIQHMEKAYGKSLAYFFDQWYYKEGYPSYTTGWYQLGNRLLLDVTQNTSHRSVGFFSMPLQYYAIGNHYQDTLLLQADPTKNKEDFVFSVPFKTDAIIFDPLLNILSKGNQLIDRNLIMKGGAHLYPNPVNDVLKIRFTDPFFRNPKLQLYNVLGQMVAELQLNGILDNFDWDLRPLSDGHYSLRITSDQSTVIKPLILQGR